MQDRIRIEALRRAQQFAETIRRAANGIDRRTAPELGAELVRAAGVVVASLTFDASAPGPAVARRMATAASAIAELETLLAMAVGLEVLGARGPRLVHELGKIRQLHGEWRRLWRVAGSGHAA